MAANYPGAAVNVPNLVPGQDLAGPPTHESMHTSLEEELEAVAAYAAKAVRGGDERVRIVSAGAAHTIDLTLGNGQKVTMTANTALTFPTITGVSVGRMVSFLLILRQDATGGRVPTFPASVRWLAGAAPTVNATANKETWIAFTTVDDGATWNGSYVGSV